MCIHCEDVAAFFFCLSPQGKVPGLGEVSAEKLRSKKGFNIQTWAQLYGQVTHTQTDRQQGKEERKKKEAEVESISLSFFVSPNFSPLLQFFLTSLNRDEFAKFLSAEFDDDNLDVPKKQAGDIADAIAARFSKYAFIDSKTTSVRPSEDRGWRDSTVKKREKESIIAFIFSSHVFPFPLWCYFFHMT
jgi:hypothetical protein